MSDPIRLLVDDACYPARLRALQPPPREVTLHGDAREGDRIVAIVGTRKPTPEAAEFAHALAVSLAEAGVVVVSGGAVGIDAAAHRGAIAGGGRTWVVAPTGVAETYPAEHKSLYAQVVDSGGCMIWPFAERVGARPQNFLARNAVLVALADHVVLVQAGVRSGALNAAALARRLGRPLWAVATAPWQSAGFEGCWSEVERGARPLGRAATLLRALDINHPIRPPAPAVRADLSASELAIASALSSSPRHADEVAALTALPAECVQTALFDLQLKELVMEGPPGFFRKRPT